MEKYGIVTRLPIMSKRTLLLPCGGFYHGTKETPKEEIKNVKRTA